MKLNASARNCSLAFSLMLVFLLIDRSRLTTPGSRTSGNTRPRLPYVNGGGFTNTAVLNHSAIVGLLSLADWPVEFGRLARLLFAPLTCVGKPTWKVAIDCICQPPTIAFNTAFWMRTSLFLPNGNS